MAAQSIRQKLKLAWDAGKIVAIVFAAGVSYNKLDNVEKNVAKITADMDASALRLNSAENRISFLEGRFGAAKPAADNTRAFVPSQIGPR